MSGSTVRLTTLGGECFEAELRSVNEYQERDGVVHKFYVWVAKLLLYRFRRAQRQGGEFGNNEITPGYTTKQSLAG